MTTAAPHHLTYNGRPYCTHTSCMAGLDLAKRAGVDQCDYASKASAVRARQALKRVTSATVRVAPGYCTAA